MEGAGRIKFVLLLGERETGGRGKEGRKKWEEVKEKRKEKREESCFAAED